MPRPPRARRTRSNRRAEAVAPRNEQQLFVFGNLIFDVERAHTILRRAPRPACRIPVQPWAAHYGLDGNPRTLITPSDTFDRDYAMTTDLTRPVLLATLRTSDGEESPLLIDGCHRLYKANVRGVLELPAFVLTGPETHDIIEH